MGFFSWLREILNYDPSVYRPNEGESKPLTMNEGDLRSGPDGYSASTGYPDSFYGSGGFRGSNGAQDEGDFKR